MSYPPLYVDLHIIQTLPPSNINRDDVGSPKTAMYGGVTRLRASSQSWKRATRKQFVGVVDRADLGTRTQRIAGMLAARLQAATGIPSEQAEKIAAQLRATALPMKADAKAGTKAGDTPYLLFFGRRQLDRIVELLAPSVTELVALDDAELKARLTLHKDEVQRLLMTGHPVDVALFGRMVADIPAINVDAATQVAHALSTHEVSTEFDYFTAVDDENTAAETGASMIENVEFTSATLYRYASIGVHQLLENLGSGESDPARLRDAAVEAVTLFVDSFARSVPSGYQNSFAHRTLPSSVSVTLRSDQPVNLVGAFERPVRAVAGRGIVGESVRSLAREAMAVGEVWGVEPDVTISTYSPAILPDEEARDLVMAGLGAPVSFPELLGRLEQALSERISEPA